MYKKRVRYAMGIVLSLFGFPMSIASEEPLVRMIGAVLVFSGGYFLAEWHDYN